MTAAIALPISTAPAASALQTVAPSASGEGFAAALAALLGLGAAAVPNHGAQPHASIAKTQPAQGTTPPDSQPNPALVATPPAPHIIAPAPAAIAPAALQLAPTAARPAKAKPVQTPVVAPSETANALTPAATVPAAQLIVPSGAVPAKGTKAQAPLVASNATARAAAAPAIAARPTETPAPIEPQTPAVIAQRLSATTATNSATALPTPATAAKAASKPATAKHTATPATDAQTQASIAKPVTAPQVAPQADRPPSDATAGKESELAAGKVDATPPQPASPPPFVVNLHAVADPRTPVAPGAVAQAIVPLDALAVHIARKFESGESRFEIRLDPAELGRLDISLTVDHDGRVQAILRAERPETLDMLQRDARVLESQLRQTGLSVDSNSLNFSLGHGNGNRQAFADGNHTFARALDLAPELEPTKTSSAIVSLRDGVDIRI